MERDVVSWPTAVNVFQPDVVLGHITPWDVTDRLVPPLGDEWVWIGMPTYDEYIASEYRLASEVLSAGGAHVYWLEGTHLRRTITPQNHPDRIDRLNMLVAAATADMDLVSIAPYREVIGEVGSSQERRMRDDGVHLTPDGLTEVARWVLEDVFTERR
jgi:lysophospholipase L1-like esterase